jgi:hypothetical protein
VEVRPWLAGNAAGAARLATALAQLLAGKQQRDGFRQPQAMAEIGG